MADLSLNLDFSGVRSGGAGLSKRENKKHQQFLKRRKYLERRGFLKQKQLPHKLGNKNPGAGQQQQKPNTGERTNQNAQSGSHSQKAQKSNINFFHQQGAPNNADHSQKKPPINLFQSHQQGAPNNAENSQKKPPINLFQSNQQGAAQSTASATPTPKGLANGHTPTAKDQSARPAPQLPSPASLLSEFASGIQPSHKIVAIDCEMVGTGPKGSVSALARCSIVTYHGDIVYDRYIKPAAPVTDYRTRWSGIRREHLARAVPFATAQKEILKILQGKTVIGHAIQNDYKALGYFHPQELTRDTSKIPALNRKAGFPEKELASLKRLAKQLLHKDIQTGRGGHCSVEDAKTTMQLYRVVEEEHERELAVGRGH